MRYLVILFMLGFVCTASGQDELGKEEFGLTGQQLAANIVKVEKLIAAGMKQKGFTYIAQDIDTVRSGMSADKSFGELSEEQFTEKYGFGVATFYTGKPPQLNDGYCPARVGLGEQNVKIFQGLSPKDQVAYNRALLGDNTDVSFAVALELEDFSRCGGCTLEAIKKVLEPDLLKANYRSPLDFQVSKHWLMKLHIKMYRDEMAKAGFEYKSPDEVEPEIRTRLAKITGGKTVPVEKLSAEQKKQLESLKKIRVEGRPSPPSLGNELCRSCGRKNHRRHRIPPSKGCEEKARAIVESSVSCCR